MAVNDWEYKGECKKKHKIYQFIAEAYAGEEVLYNAHSMLMNVANSNQTNLSTAC